jgi:glycosyltransferase involved in cell wall biosynthesis
MKLGNAVIACCTKNSEPFLPAGLKNFEKIASLFNKCSFVFVENDSSDNTKEIINTWGRSKENFHFINFDGLDYKQKHRTLRLEITRNAYINFIRNNPTFKDTHFVFVIDLDDRATHPLKEDDLIQAIIFLQNRKSVAAVFANQIGHYYDLWALRHQFMCPFDFWHEVMKFALKFGCTDQEAMTAIYSQVIHTIDPSQEPILVDSAFGGLGVYKYEYLIENPVGYTGSSTHYVLENSEPFFYKMESCEHISLHRGITLQGGEMYIMPALINGMNNSEASFNPSAFRNLIIN